MSKAEKFGTKLKDSSIHAYRKMRDCHPIFKEKITPTVEWIWQLFPLNIIAYNPFLFVFTQMMDLGGLLCCWCCWIPWQLGVVCPWNTTWALLLGTVLVVILLIAFVAGLILSAVSSLGWFAWLGVQGAIAVTISLFGFIIAFFGTGGLAATGTAAILGPFAFIGMIWAAFLSTLGM